MSHRNEPPKTEVKALDLFKGPCKDVQVNGIGGISIRYCGIFAFHQLSQLPCLLGLLEKLSPVAGKDCHSTILVGASLSRKFLMIPMFCSSHS